MRKMYEKLVKIKRVKKKVRQNLLENKKKEDGFHNFLFNNGNVMYR